jgi:hypothetical protein
MSDDTRVLHPGMTTGDYNTCCMGTVVVSLIIHMSLLPTHQQVHAWYMPSCLCATLAQGVLRVSDVQHAKVFETPAPGPINVGSLFLSAGAAVVGWGSIIQLRSARNTEHQQCLDHNGGPTLLSGLDGGLAVKTYTCSDAVDLTGASGDWATRFNYTRQYDQQWLVADAGQGSVYLKPAGMYSYYPV